MLINGSSPFVGGQFIRGKRCKQKFQIVKKQSLSKHLKQTDRQNFLKKKQQHNGKVCMAAPNIQTDEHTYRNKYMQLYRQADIRQTFLNCF